MGTGDESNSDDLAIIRPAVRHDLAEVVTLLELLHLGSEDIELHFGNFFVGVSQGKIVGTIGLELYTEAGLLRSAAVLPSYQSHGIGGKLINALLLYASQHRIRQVFLLTTTAEKYFAARGFTQVHRETVSGEILTSAQFRYACPANAVVMMKELRN